MRTHPWEVCERDGIAVVVVEPEERGTADVGGLVNCDSAKLRLAMRSARLSSMSTKPGHTNQHVMSAISSPACKWLQTNRQDTMALWGSSYVPLGLACCAAPLDDGAEVAGEGFVLALFANGVGGYGGGGGILTEGEAGVAAGGVDNAPLDADGTNLHFVECATIESAGNCWQQRMHLIGRLEHRAV